jgi:uncharacterized protein (DUF433 family)
MAESGYHLGMSTDDLLSRITIRPEQCHGRACIRGMRIRVIDILEMLAGGTSPEEILEDFPYLEADDIRASLAYAATELNRPIANAAE